MGASAILEVVWLGTIGSVLILLQYVYYIRIIQNREKRIDEVERAPINDVLKKIVNTNVEVEASWIYRCYKKGEEAGIMLIYEDCYCCENANINEIMQGYHDIALKEYAKLNRIEIDFVSTTGGRVYVSFGTNMYGKNYLVVFTIQITTTIDKKGLDLKVEKLKRDLILRITV